MTRIAVLVSGGGTNLQALLDAQRESRLGGGEIVLVVSSSPTAYALERAKERGIATAVLTRKEYPDGSIFDQALLALLEEHRIDLVVMAGYLRIFGGAVIRRYDRRIINIHPSLIPSFCGMGFYGLKVHQAALDYGVKITGATVHFVSEVVDGGEILLQKAVEVLPDDTPEILQKRVMEQAEWTILPKAVELFCTGQLSQTERGSLAEPQQRREQSSR